MIDSSFTNSLRARPAASACSYPRLVRVSLLSGMYLYTFLFALPIDCPCRIKISLFGRFLLVYLPASSSKLTVKPQSQPSRDGNMCLAFVKSIYTIMTNVITINSVRQTVTTICVDQIQPNNAKTNHLYQSPHSMIEGTPMTSLSRLFSLYLQRSDL